MSSLDIKDLIKTAKEDNKIIFIKDFFNNLPDWKEFYNIFQKALSSSAAGMYFPGTLTVDSSEKYTSSFDKIVTTLERAHPGQKIAVLSIIHFVNAYDNTIPEAAAAFYDDFKASNDKNMPPDFDLSLLKPAIHSDPVDGFYIQCEGQTTWRAYYDDHVDEYPANPGDLLYIPKGINHSVESMNIRAAISVSFFDE
jgi:mannose-6-phosphate isomerase-like protein (cupin superfamily)